MSARALPPDPVEILSVGGDVQSREVRALSRRAHDALARGARRLVVDLTAARSVAEGPLTLALLGLRPALARIDGRVVIVATDDVTDCLGRLLRLDDLFATACSRADALVVARREALSERFSGVHCDVCKTRWHPRRSELLLVANPPCPRCRGQLTRPVPDSLPNR